MPKLIKNINGSILDNLESDLTFVKSLSGDVQFEDYIGLPSYFAFLQNLTQTDMTSRQEKPLMYGLKNSVTQTTLTINY